MRREKAAGGHGIEATKVAQCAPITSSTVDRGLVLSASLPEGTLSSPPLARSGLRHKPECLFVAGSSQSGPPFHRRKAVLQRRAAARIRSSGRSAACGRPRLLAGVSSRASKRRRTASRSPVRETRKNYYDAPFARLSARSSVRVAVETVRCTTVSRHAKSKLLAAWTIWTADSIPGGHLSAHALAAQVMRLVGRRVGANSSDRYAQA
jgi:hypothetical protein